MAGGRAQRSAGGPVIVYEGAAILDMPDEQEPFRGAVVRIGPVPARFTAVYLRRRPQHVPRHVMSGFRPGFSNIGANAGRLLPGSSKACEPLLQCHEHATNTSVVTSARLSDDLLTYAWQTGKHNDFLCSGR